MCELLHLLINSRHHLLSKPQTKVPMQTSGLGLNEANIPFRSTIRPFHHLWSLLFVASSLCLSVSLFAHPSQFLRDGGRHNWLLKKQRAPYSTVCLNCPVIRSARGLPTNWDRLYLAWQTEPSRWIKTVAKRNTFTQATLRGTTYLHNGI